MPLKKLAVFDWNGTILADSHITWRVAAECIRLAGGRSIDRARHRETVTLPLMDMFLANGCDAETVHRGAEEQRTLFAREYDRHARTCGTRQGLRALLAWLDDRNVHKIILSNHTEEDIRFHLRRLKLESHFPHVSAHPPEHGSILYRTSKKERLADYLAMHGFRPEHSVMLGDSTEEPRVARALGLTCISVAGGDFSTSRLRAANPHHIVRKLSDAIPFLERHWGFSDQSEDRKKTA